ncbi:hypothetical protein ACLBYD_18610 [Rhodococcus sp. C26F]
MQLVLGIIAALITISLVRSAWAAGAARSLLYVPAAFIPMGFTYLGWNDTDGGMWVAWPYYVVATVVLARQLVLVSRRLPHRGHNTAVASWAEPATSMVA